MCIFPAVSPRSPSNLVFLGMNLASFENTNPTIQALVNGSSTVASSGQQMLAVTPPFPLRPGVIAFGYYSTVYPDDPTRALVTTATVLDEYFADVFSVSKHAAVSITDHTGTREAVSVHDGGYAA